jgi:hypothetical protein
MQPNYILLLIIILPHQRVLICFAELLSTFNFVGFDVFTAVKFCFVEFGVLTGVAMKSMVFWAVT